jgi:hypothetical protein
MISALVERACAPALSTAGGRTARGFRISGAEQKIDLYQHQLLPLRQRIWKA